VLGRVNRTRRRQQRLGRVAVMSTTRSSSPAREAYDARAAGDHRAPRLRPEKVACLEGGRAKRDALEVSR
jgi:hypothetical protein